MTENTLVTKMKVDVTDQVQRLISDVKKTPEWQELKQSVDVVNKARAVLAVHKEAIEIARRNANGPKGYVIEHSFNEISLVIAMISLADILEANHE